MTASPFPLEMRGVNYISVSPSGKRMAVVRGDTRPPGKPGAEPAQFVEIWGGEGLEVAIPTAGKHEGITRNGVFECFCWSADENKIVYCGEGSAPETTSWAEPVKEKATPGGKFDGVQSWGESMSKCIRPQLFVLDINARTINNALQVRHAQCEQC